MATTSAYNRAAIERPIGLRARNDLGKTAVAFTRQTAYVLKDPLTLEFIHLTADEYFLFRLLENPISLSQLRQEFERKFAPRQISHEALQHGINQLYSEGLLLSEATGQGHELFKRGERRKRNERLQSLLQLLSFRLGSIDATRFIEGVYGKVRWLFTTPMLAVAAAIVFYAGWILLTRGAEVVTRLPSVNELTRPENWLLWLATFVVVKIVHEMAHATTCRHFGGRCHEIGVLLLAGVPCLYCDVTDVWRLPSKWRRIAVSAAGMIAELVIAAVALIAWWHTQPGLFNTWCLSLVVVCSVGTLLVNGNPLLRYDGYYILSDLVEVPNLAGRAQGLLPSMLRRWLLGEPRVDDPLLNRTQQRGLLVYAVAARIYLTLVLLSIFVALLAWTRPYHLENLVYTVGVITLLGMLIRPLTALWRMSNNPALRSRIRKQRVAILLAGVAATIAVVLFLPITHSVSGPVVLVPVEGKTVYATIAGEIRYAVAVGTRVEQGEVLARLADPDVEIALAQQQGEYDVFRVRYDQMNAMRALDERVLQRLPAAQAALVDAELQMEESRQQAEELVVRAPVAGTVVAPPRIDEATKDTGRLPSWSGSPLEPRNLGCWVEAGTVLCTVADPRRLEALLAIDQADVSKVEAGQRVRLRFDSAPSQVFEGEVLQVARRAAKRPVDATRTERGRYHLVQIQLDSQELNLLVGARGTAKIEASRMTFGKKASTYLRRMLQLPW